MHHMHRMHTHHMHTHHTHTHHMHTHHMHMQVDQLIGRMDQNNDGLISEEEFVAFFMHMTDGIDDTTFDEGILKYLETAKKIEKYNRESFQGTYEGDD